MIFKNTTIILGQLLFLIIKTTYFGTERVKLINFFVHFKCNYTKIDIRFYLLILDYQEKILSLSSS